MKEIGFTWIFLIFLWVISTGVVGWLSLYLHFSATYMLIPIIVGGVLVTWFTSLMCKTEEEEDV